MNRSKALAVAHLLREALQERNADHAKLLGNEPKTISPGFVEKMANIVEKQLDAINSNEDQTMDNTCTKCKKRPGKFPIASLGKPMLVCGKCLDDMEEGNG